ncbi:MAG: hypothetical protein LAN84_07600 [Acidobacteriia bacterium]|nr:hypothetical protein [Terriglobia bacterium]
MPKKSLPSWLAFAHIKSVVSAGVILCFASYTLNLVFSRLGISRAATILDDLAMGLLGSLLLFVYLSALYESQCHARAKERAILVAELNYHIRGALTALGHCVLLEDREARLRHYDDAVATVDHVLTDLLPTTGSAKEPRLFLPEEEVPCGQHSLH